MGVACEGERGNLPMRATYRCPQPGCRHTAEASASETMASTHGPVAHVSIVCPEGHWFYLPEDFLERCFEETAQSQVSVAV